MWSVEVKEFTDRTLLDEGTTPAAGNDIEEMVLHITQASAVTLDDLDNPTKAR